MDEIAKRAVGRVIESMRENLAEPLTIDEMARTAMFSKFHFSRIFQRVTGISPGRFLAAVRLHRAMQLLVSTSLSVTEISHQVGYSSVGTFSSRFSSSVGVSPRTFRRLGGVAPDLAVRDGGARAASPSATVEGEVLAPHTGEDRVVFVGLFPDPVSLGRPASCTVLPGPGPYTLDDAPPGRWYVRAHGVRPTGAGRCFVVDRAAESVSCLGPFVIRPGSIVRADLRLRPIGAYDPPVLLPGLRPGG